MGDLVANVLQMTRLEGGAIAPERDWHALGEIAGTVLGRLRSRVADHPVRIWLPDKLPLVRVDAILIEQALANLFENAAKYTPPGTAITLSAEIREGEVVVSVEDAGPGLPEGDPEQLFAKFHRGSPESAIGGVGLGLAICRAIVTCTAGGSGPNDRRRERRSCSRCRSRPSRRCRRSDRTEVHRPRGGGRA
jgi:two-component system sensor histidine kinase KdpD